MRRYFIHLGLTLLVAGILGVIVLVGGLAPIKASSGHWPITYWLLDFAKTRSVATHSMNIEPPDLDKPYRIAQGAGLYEMNCSWCHGSPARPVPRIPAAMTPNPPGLEPKVAKYEPSELFYIIKHGIKFTGMPAWPSQTRDDEVWAVVAFCLTLPDTDAATYRSLAMGQPETGELAVMPKPGPPENLPEAVRATCAICHGAEGSGRESGAFPKIAGQKSDYLAASLQAYRNGNRESGAMEPVAARLSDAEIDELAQYYSALSGDHALRSEASGNYTANGITESLTDARLVQARSIVEQGNPSRRVPSCADCHLPGGRQVNSFYPYLQGQHAEYLELQLILFQQRHRGGTEYSHLMHSVVDGLSPEQIGDLARYLAAIPAAKAEFGARD